MTKSQMQLRQINLMRTETFSSDLFQFEIIESGELQGQRYNVVRSGCGSDVKSAGTAPKHSESKLVKNNANTAEADIKG